MESVLRHLPLFTLLLLDRKFTTIMQCQREARVWPRCDANYITEIFLMIPGHPLDGPGHNLLLQIGVVNHVLDATPQQTWAQ